MVDDHVQGRVSCQNKGSRRSRAAAPDGLAPYMLAVVVDEINDMGVTHVIRRETTISTNAARQTADLRRRFRLGGARRWRISADSRNGTRQTGRSVTVRFRVEKYPRDWAICREALTQLSGATPLGAWRPGRCFRRRRLTEGFDLPRSALAGAVRFRQAGKSQPASFILRQSEDARLLEALEAILPQIGPERACPRRLRRTCARNSSPPCPA